MSAVGNVLVVGGGIAGLAAAIALRHQGIDVDLVERQRNWTVYGVGIIQPSNTLRALDRIGLATACVAAGAGFPGWQIHDAAGGLILEAAASNRAAPAFPPINGITRPKLHRILVDAAEAAGVVLRLGCVVEDLQSACDGVDVTLTTGVARRYDLVVAADGVQSDTRSRIFGDACRPAFTGQAVWRYNLPRPPEMGWGGIYFGRTSKAGLVPLSPTLMYMFLVTPERNDIWLPTSSLAEEMRARLAGYPGLIREITPLIENDHDVVYRPMHNLVLPAPWMKKRVIVIGDAAHTTTPHLAQGAAMAVEDAVLLGELMGRNQPVDDLLRAFMERRLPRARFVVETSAQIAAWELEEWNGVDNPQADPAGLLHQAGLILQDDF